MAISLNDVQRGYDAWAAKPHNAKWVRKIDGTPIANDVVVNIFEAIKDLSAGQAQPVAIKPNHVNGGAYRKISVEEWRALGGDGNKFCDWHEGIGYVVYDDQAREQYSAKMEAAAPSASIEGETP